MMKKIVFVLGIVLCAALAGTAFLPASSEEKITKTQTEFLDTIQLPDPQLDIGRPLMQVLKDRQSKRTFSDQKLSLQTLSNLLWAAWGVNRPGSDLRTAPNVQPISTYVAMEEGLYLYDAAAHQLQLVLAEDVRENTCLSFHWEGYASPAPVHLVHTAPLSSWNYSFIFANSGYINQNIYLYCASEGLVTVTRGSFPEDLAQVIGLPEDHIVTLCQTIGYNKLQHSLYFPCIETEGSWESEVAVVNNSGQAVSGVLKVYDNRGLEVSDGAGMLGTGMPLDLEPRARKVVNIGTAYNSPDYISYGIFMSDSDQVAGYTKLYLNGSAQAAVPAVREVNEGDICLTHVVSDENWWTRICLLNTTWDPKEVTIEFDNETSKTVSLPANGHSSSTIAEFFGGEKQPAIKSGVIKNGAGVVGAAVLGKEDQTQLCGIVLKGDSAATICYPHVTGITSGWWTGLGAYNPFMGSSNLTLTPYDASGGALTPVVHLLGGKEKWMVSNFDLPANTAWVELAGTGAVAGFELFGANNGNTMDGFDTIDIGGTTGVFPKIAKWGWTWLALVNTEGAAAAVTLTAYDDAGTVVAAEPVTLNGHAKLSGFVSALFTEDISTATYVAYESDKELVGFQLNGSLNNMMMDALPAGVVE